MQPNLILVNDWSLLRKISFRFFCCLFILYTFPFPLDSLPFASGINRINEGILGWYYWLIDQVTNFWHWLIPLVGKYIFGLKTPITIFTNGSGDTTYDYVLLFTHFLLATVISTIWSILDRKRKSYNTAYYWLCVLIRYYLAAMLLLYGIIKVFHLQMPSPSLSRLLQPYGNSSPMGLVWTYVGQSKAFSVVVGLSEAICGLLLLFRKTTLAGAILTLIVMGNVVIINLCYDVPVKLFSSMLELMALYLAAPYFKKIYEFFVSHKPAVVENYIQPVFKRKWIRIGTKVLKVLIITDLLYSNVSGNIISMNDYGDLRPKPRLYGIYNAELIVRNNDTIPLLLTDSISWKQIIVDYEGTATIRTMNDSASSYNFKVDSLSKTVDVSDNNTKHIAMFNIVKDSSKLSLYGRVDGDSVHLRFRRFDEKNFLLMNRGFRWINEYPFNR